jgi:hypothetical protein
MYDAWAAHDELAFGSRLGGLLRRPATGRTQDARREAASFAAHRALSDLFPTEATAIAKQRTFDSVRPVSAIRFLFAGRHPRRREG